MKVEELYSLYKQSKQKVINEEMIQESLLLNIIKNLDKEANYLCDAIQLYISDKKYEEILLRKLQNSISKEIKSIEKISLGGYESYYYEITFKIKNSDYRIEIPNASAICISNINHANYGMYRLLQEECESCWNLIKTSYSLKDIKEELEKII